MHSFWPLQSISKHWLSLPCKCVKCPPLNLEKQNASYLQSCDFFLSLQSLIFRSALWQLLSMYSFFSLVMCFLCLWGKLCWKAGWIISFIYTWTATQSNLWFGICNMKNYNYAPESGNTLLYNLNSTMCFKYFHIQIQKTRF